MRCYWAYSFARTQPEAHAYHGAACQLAATERFPWPFPPPDADACDLMIDILAWEKDQDREED